MELKEWVHTPYHGKQYVDSTLRGMKKEELIQIVRDYEHNYNALYEANEPESERRRRRRTARPREV